MQVKDYDTTFPWQKKSRNDGHAPKGGPTSTFAVEELKPPHFSVWQRLNHTPRDLLSGAWTVGSCGTATQSTKEALIAFKEVCPHQ